MGFRVTNTRVEWLEDGLRPSSGEVLMIPANDHLWMLSGPGLELKKAHGKEIELEAVRLGPLEMGSLAVTAGGPTGFRWIYHAVVAGQDFAWVAGAGRRAVQAALERAAREKISSMVVYPLYWGMHGRHDEPAREILGAFLAGLQQPTSLRAVSILYHQAEEKHLLHESFLRLLAEPDAR